MKPASIPKCATLLACSNLKYQRQVVAELKVIRGHAFGFQYHFALKTATVRITAYVYVMPTFEEKKKLRNT
jgi:hypothetical protein